MLQEFGLTSKFRDSKVEQEVSASYKADKYALKASVNPAGKVGAVWHWKNALCAALVACMCMLAIETLHHLMPAMIAMNVWQLCIGHIPMKTYGCWFCRADRHHRDTDEPSAQPDAGHQRCTPRPIVRQGTIPARFPTTGCCTWQLCADSVHMQLTRATCVHCSLHWTMPCQT